MKFKPDSLSATPGRKVRLSQWATRMKPLYKSERDYKEKLLSDLLELESLQRVLYASGTRAVLLIFQALDAAGKDGAISHVMSGVNPEGCSVHSFKTPSTEEAAHDFLWRTTCRLPRRGEIGIFNRSYYEEVLIVKVHSEVLESETLPAELLDKESIWEGRYRSIVDFERHLHRNGTKVVKFYLHLSKEEQRRRFLARIDEPKKNWKFSLADVKERKYWGAYMKAYEEALGATTTKHAPWHVIPADDKLNARLMVSRIVIDAIKGLDLKMPKVTAARRRELQAIRRTLKK
ncbi:MAG TPA: ADP-polyphosphate phosphotransferase [Opitutaceae bacterium]|jgi:PPK2 family polyphosphate:nucleotide phosphotransferase|nr:ADP-polyphosphate phosphotransferase [Opitutaceae bacterium]